MGNVSKVLYDNVAITNDGTQQNFQIGPKTSTTAGFSFDLLDQVMNVPVDGNNDYNVTAVINVEYVANDGTTMNTLSESLFSFRSFRSVTPATSQNSKFGESIKVFGQSISKNNGNKITSGIFLLIALFLFFLHVVFILSFFVPLCY